MPAIHLLVEGRVQGVGFRWFVRELAQELGVAGWVRNTEDGSVELQAGGDEPHLTRFLEAVRTGPPAARVRRVVTVRSEVVENLPFPFTVLK